MGGYVSIAFKNQLAEITRLGQVVEDFAEAHGLPSKLTFELNVALEEILTNVILYGYSDAADHDIVLRLAYVNETVTAEVEDDGQPFNPLAAPPPDTHAPLEERRVGGLGIHLVRKLMNSVDYDREGAKNRLTMKKHVAVEPRRVREA
jgi:anti-sigma regulatory factor (Ser/Thr protein kinase)